MTRLLSILLISLFSIASCSNSEDEWYAYTIELPNLKSTTKIIMVHIDHDNNEYLLHWFFYDEGVLNGSEHRIFGRLSTTGTRDSELKQINFSHNFEQHNEFKSLHHEPRTVPFGKPVIFRFDLVHKLLKLEGASIKRVKNKTNAEVLKCIEEHENWTGERIEYSSSPSRARSNIFGIVQ